MEVCISCGQELAIMERNRAECWECRDKAIESYSDDEDMGLAGSESVPPQNHQTTNQSIFHQHV
ncbi:hypothetical protein [Neobacillus sp. Marseille-QA0830]